MAADLFRSDSNRHERVGGLIHLKLVNLLDLLVDLISLKGEATMKILFKISLCKGNNMSDFEL